MLEPVLRQRVLMAAVWAGGALTVGTEVLSWFSALRAPWIAGYWLLAAALGTGAAWRSWREWRWPRLDPFASLCCLGIGVIHALTLVTAIWSPPNSSDAMAYHLPRVVYWAEQASVRFYPSAYLNQLMLQPLAEYASLHLYLLSGGDGLTNLIAWVASVASSIGVSAVAAQLGFPARGQALAALFCATLPAGILAASGAKNDWPLALWTIAAVYFAVRFARTGEGAALLGIATGCALLTKATAYLFLPALLLAVLWGARRRKAGLLVAAALALALNLPHYGRNIGLSGSPLGFDAAQGDGVYRWRNSVFGWRPAVSNALRHFSEQMGARGEGWNQWVYRQVLVAHEGIGADPNDPATTWYDAVYRPPRNANHEADANNRWHLLLLGGCCWLCWRSRSRLLYTAALLAGFAAVCVYLRWQPFMARLFLPWFVAAAPLAAAWVEVPVAGVLAGALLLDGARLPATQNWVRPLTGPKSVLRVPRTEQYFSDLTPWNNRRSYEETVETLAQSSCRVVGVDTTVLQIEYPLLALLRARVPEVRFLHTGVENASRHYPPPVPEQPCAIVCLDCAGAAAAAKYQDFGKTLAFGKFLVYWRR